MARTRKRFSDQLRQAIQRADKTRYQISLETDIAQSTLSRFIHGKGGLSLESIDLVCESIGAQLMEDSLKSRPSKRKGG